MPSPTQGDFSDRLLLSGTQCPGPSLADGLKVHVMEAAYRSSEEKRWVAVSEVL